MRKFKIPVESPTTVKTIRFPNDLIDKIEENIAGKQSTFSAFVVEAARLAVEDLEKEKIRNKRKIKI